MNAKYQHLTWLIGTLAIWLLLVCGTMLTNYALDPYAVFKDQGFSGNRVGNLRFGKISWLKENHQNYNAYILGSSRTATFDPHYLKQYEKEYDYYNLWAQMSTPDDQLRHLQYMLDKKWPVKKLLIQYDLGPNFLVDPGMTLCRLHPDVRGTSLLLEYLRYLSLFPREDWSLMLKLRGSSLSRTSSIETGYSFNHDLERKVATNTEKYIAETNDFHRNPPRSQLPEREIIDKKIAAMKAIQDLAADHGIEVVTFIAPHHWAYLDGLNKKAWLYELEKLATLMPVYNFASYNAVTLDNANYYEYSHYRPHITQQVIDIIYGEDEPENDFGLRLDAGSINSYLPQLVKTIEERDINRNQQ